MFVSHKKKQKWFFYGKNCLLDPAFLRVCSYDKDSIHKDKTLLKNKFRAIPETETKSHILPYISY